MATNTTDVTAVLRRLAEAEDGNGQPRYRDAQGWALFRKPCPNHIIPLSLFVGPLSAEDMVAEAEYEAKFHREKCPCQGLRWLPLDMSDVHLEAVLEAVSQAGMTTQHIYSWNGEWTVCFRPITVVSIIQESTAKTMVEAAILALDALVRW